MIIFLLKYLMFNSQDILWFGTYKILTWMKVHYIQNIIIFFFKHFQIEHYLTMECILKILINIKKMYIKPQCLQICSWSFLLIALHWHQTSKFQNEKCIKYSFIAYFERRYVTILRCLIPPKNYCSVKQARICPFIVC